MVYPIICRNSCSSMILVPYCSAFFNLLAPTLPPATRYVVSLATLVWNVPPRARILSAASSRLIDSSVPVTTKFCPSSLTDFFYRGSTPKFLNFSSNFSLSSSANHATIDSATTLPTPSTCSRSSMVAFCSASTE